MLADGYEPAYDRDYAYGHQGELAVDGLLEGLTRGDVRAEIKRKSVPDCDLYVELEQNPFGRGEWKPSGLNVTAAEVWIWVIADTEAFVVLPVARLRRAVDLGLGKPVQAGGSNPTRGRLLSLGLLLSARCDP